MLLVVVHCKSILTKRCISPILNLHLLLAFAKESLSFALRLFWLAYTHKVALYSLNALVNVFSSLFIMLILIAGLGIEWLLIGYGMYGAMQAGCELSWNLSDRYFQKIWKVRPIRV
ncbi:MAG: hypothetical protein H0T62_11560 [Parachlamydiaceae bacterium]|nr:hypothetical protein [Parachlamydiaceae bacterium]